MRTDQITSFVNGIIAGSSAMLAITAIFFLKIVNPLEGKSGITTVEIRLGIFFGLVVCVIAILYEIYRRKNSKSAEELNRAKKDEQ